MTLTQPELPLKGRASVTPKASKCPRPRRLLQSLDLAEDDLEVPRRRTLAEDAFERAASVGHSLTNGRATNGFDAATDDFMDEVNSSVRRMRASKARAAIDELDDDFESVVTRRKHQALLRHERGQTLADKHLEAVGITKIRDPEDDPFFRKRVLRITSAAEDSPDFTRWTKVNPVAEILEDSAAVARARKTRDRLADLESEIEDVAERSARRDRRAAELRSFLAENTSSAVEDSSSSAVRVSLKSEKKTVTF